MDGFYRWLGQDLVLHCHLQPKAKTDEIVGEHGGRLKIRITAPPVDGKANIHLCNFISRQFAVAHSDVRIIQGELGRQKTLLIRQPGRIPDAIAKSHPGIAGAKSSV